jgi:hypothetical protein
MQVSVWPGVYIALKVRLPRLSWSLSESWMSTYSALAVFDPQILASGNALRRL